MVTNTVREKIPVTFEPGSRYDNNNRLRQTFGIVEHHGRGNDIDTSCFGFWLSSDDRPRETRQKCYIAWKANTERRPRIN